MPFSKKHLTDLSLVSLVAANLIPIWGVLFNDWNAFNIVVLYWAENLVIGFFTITKMVIAPMAMTPKAIEFFKSNPDISIRTGRMLFHGTKLFFVPFFASHYGGFTGGHGFFILMIFKQYDPSIGLALDSTYSWPFVFIFIEMLYRVVKELFMTMPENMIYPLVAMFISHTISFFYDHLYKGGYKNLHPSQLMVQPYPRIMILHIAVIGGSVMAMMMGSPVSIVLLLVALKIMFDIKMHLRDNAKKQDLAD